MATLDVGTKLTVFAAPPKFFHFCLGRSSVSGQIKLRRHACKRLNMRLDFAWSVLRKAAWPEWAWRIPVYAIGTMAAFWTIERITGF